MASCLYVARNSRATLPFHPPQIFDRAAKGIREAPSKALIGELAAASGDSPTAAFGLRQSMALLGASAGASVASLALALTHGNYPLTFSLSTVPAVLALVLLSAAFGPGSSAAIAGGRSRGCKAWPSRRGTSLACLSVVV